MELAAKTKLVHIIVEVNKKDHRRVEFDVDEVTGRQIKEKAGVPVEDDLALRRQGQLVLVTNDEVIKIKDGMHFIDFPAGTIS